MLDGLALDEVRQAPERSVLLQKSRIRYVCSVELAGFGTYQLVQHTFHIQQFDPTGHVEGKQLGM